MKNFLKTKNDKLLAGGLAVILVVLVCFLCTHTIIHGKAYANNAQYLNLQDKNITPEHFDAVREAFPDIEILWDVPFQGGKIPSTLPELEVSTLSDEDVAMLGYLPCLKTVDATNCIDYPQLEALRLSLPGTQVIYKVPIDGKTYAQDTRQLTLTGLTARDLELVQYLPELTAVDAAGCDDYDLLLQLREQYPQIDLSYNVPIGGTEYAQDTRTLALTEVTTEEMLQMLRYLPELESVTVENPLYSEISMPYVAAAYPDVAFYWEMDVFGVRMTSEDTSVDFTKKKLESVEAVELALANFPHLERAYLGLCRLDNEELAAYRDRVRPEYKVVWQMLLGAVYVNTDDTWFMPGKYGKGLVEEQAQLLKYCEDMVCIDVGHKPLLTCEFVRYMPNLRYLILADTNITDITPLETCKNLVFLELFMSLITDYTPLQGCTALEDLNIGSTWGDPEPLKQMTWLKRLWWINHMKYYEELSEALPNTQLMLYASSDDTGLGWRLGEHYYAQRDYMGVPYMG